MQTPAFYGYVFQKISRDDYQIHHLWYFKDGVFGAAVAHDAMERAMMFWAQ